ncbi:MAG: inorganic phosphate transporter [Acidobacteria bacterium]|nr:inorganic phosphate transporter [Acidobacteriota bacterium]
MGIIFVASLLAGFSETRRIFRTWEILSAHAAIMLGTLSGGWRIVKTMGSKITKLRPVGGFCADWWRNTDSVITSMFGIPVSPTHTITGAIVGAGSTIRLSAVRRDWPGENRLGLGFSTNQWSH